MFKLIAVKILEGCVSHIKKCLKDNTIYYLSNEYIISDSDKSIKKRSEYLDYLPERVRPTTQKNMKEFNKELADSSKYQTIMLNTEEGLTIALKLF